MRTLILCLIFTCSLNAGELEISENAKKADWLYDMNRTSQFKVVKEDLAIMGAVFAKNPEIDLEDLKIQCDQIEDIEERYRNLEVCKLIELY